MPSVLGKLVLFVALAFPLGAVVFLLPTLGELFAPSESAESRAVAIAASTPAITATSSRRYASLQDGPPPTLSPFAGATRDEAHPGGAEPPPSPAARLEAASIVGTGSGAVLRSEPGARQVAALREGQVILVLERKSFNNAEWARVKTEQGVEGWVAGVVLRGADVSQLPAALRAAAPAPTSSPANNAAPTPKPSPTTPISGRTHTVRPGDELRQIAASFGVSIGSIIAANPIANPDSLTVGQVLTIPDS